MSEFLYRYKANVIGVHDGDTIRCDIDLGFGTWIKNQTIRLAGIDAPEIRGEERENGLKARDWLREQILWQEVEIKTSKDRRGKYGRWLADIYFDDENINWKMVELGFGEIYKP